MITQVAMSNVQVLQIYCETNRASFVHFHGSTSLKKHCNVKCVLFTWMQSHSRGASEEAPLNGRSWGAFGEEGVGGEGGKLGKGAGGDGGWSGWKGLADEIAASSSAAGCWRALEVRAEFARTKHKAKRPSMRAGKCIGRWLATLPSMKKKMRRIISRVKDMRKCLKGNCKTCAPLLFYCCFNNPFFHWWVGGSSNVWRCIDWEQ